MGFTQQDAINTLHRENCSCVILKEDELQIYNGPGISDLFRLLKTGPDKLQGAFVADKVIGKAAAALLILGKAKEVYTDLISDGAVELLRKYPLKVSFAERVSIIKNRSKDGICPMERLCAEVNTPEECYERINEFITSMRK